MKLKNTFIFCLAILFSLALSSACNLNASLINQDPYPAVPGDYVKLVFQVTGVDNPDCGKVSFELLKKYPVSFDPGESSVIEITGGTYKSDYNSYLIVPYKVRVDENALNGANPLEVHYGSGDISNSYKSDTFYLEIEDTHADFEIHIDKYSPVTKEMTIEILNIADSNVEALTLEIPKQENIGIIGTNRVVVGDLDSNEYTTADFKADMKDGPISVKVLYTSAEGARRELVKTITYDSSYFKETSGNGQSAWFYVVILIIIALAVWFVWKRRKNRNHHLHR